MKDNAGACAKCCENIRPRLPKNMQIFKNRAFDENAGKRRTKSLTRWLSLFSAQNFRLNPLRTVPAKMGIKKHLLLTDANLLS